MTRYPEDTIQNLVSGSWYEESSSNVLSRGRLVFTQVQFFGQIPLELTATRTDALRHDAATMEAKPLIHGKARGTQDALPVAALPRLDGADCYLVNRSKQRPCLVLGTVNDPDIPKSLIRGMPKHSTAQFVPVAPFYSAEQKGRAGYNPAFVERIRHAVYPAFFWDDLPCRGGRESILRFDQIQPMGVHHQAYQLTAFKLSEEAQEIIDQWLQWMITGMPEEELAEFRELMDELDA